MCVCMYVCMYGGVAVGRRGAAPVAARVAAALAGAGPLVLEGRGEDGRTLTVGVADPSGGHVITLPDVTGTVITTANLPDAVAALRVAGPCAADGAARLTGPRIEIGPPAPGGGGGGGGGRLSVGGLVEGRFPLAFAAEYGAGRTRCGRRRL